MCESIDNLHIIPDYRGYTLRKKRWNGDPDARARQILGEARSRNEGQKMLQKEGFTVSDANKLVQRYYRSLKRIKGPEQNKRVLSPKNQQLELTTFTQNIHLLNEELHKNLRKNKMGVRHDRIEPLHPDYKRPPGFSLVPGLLGSVPGGGGDSDAKRMKSRKSSSQEDHSNG